MKSELHEGFGDDQMDKHRQNNHSLEDQSDRIIPPTPDQGSSELQATSLFGLTWKFVIGFLGWYWLIWLIYWLLIRDPDPQGYDAMFLSIVVFPAQILVLAILFLVKNFRKIGWGMLSAIASNLLISLILGLGLNAVCFIPFFF